MLENDSEVLKWFKPAKGDIPIYHTEHEREHGAKPWTYLLIPHDVITDNKTLKGLAASCTHRGKLGALQKVPPS